MTPLTNHSISVDCVVFGFDGKVLKVLLIKRNADGSSLPEDICEYKLPGSLILQNEDLNTSANRVLSKYLGVLDIYLKQLHVFSDPDRVKGYELEWLCNHYKVNTTRVVTVAYYSLVKLTPKLISFAGMRGGEWIEVQSVRKLAMDHKMILADALDALSKQFVAEPIAFELLPRKFTIRQLQTLYEAILGIDIDNRNFRKKVLSSGYITPTTEKQKDVAHKPALYYVFNKNQYERDTKRKFRLNFINWQG